MVTHCGKPPKVTFRFHTVPLSLYYSHTLTHTLYEEQVSLLTLRSLFNQLQQHQPSLLSLVYTL